MEILILENAMLRKGGTTYSKQSTLKLKQWQATKGGIEAASKPWQQHHETELVLMQQNRIEQGGNIRQHS